MTQLTASAHSPNRGYVPIILGRVGPFAPVIHCLRAANVSSMSSLASPSNVALVAKSTSAPEIDIHDCNRILSKISHSFTIFSTNTMPQMFMRLHTFYNKCSYQKQRSNNHINIWQKSYTFLLDFFRFLYQVLQIWTKIWYCRKHHFNSPGLHLGNTET